MNLGGASVDHRRWELAEANCCGPKTGSQAGGNGEIVGGDTLRFSFGALVVLRDDIGLGIDKTGSIMVVLIELRLAEGRCRAFGATPAFFAPAATGSDKPRSFPLDATPLPHVS
jgi:hypothetical protein